MTDEEVAREAELCKGDGTDRLLRVLYGESSARTIRHAVGGSNARMLFDAAAEIKKLRGDLQALLERNLQALLERPR